MRSLGRSTTSTDNVAGPRVGWQDSRNVLNLFEVVWTFIKGLTIGGWRTIVGGAKPDSTTGGEKRGAVPAARARQRRGRLMTASTRNRCGFPGVSEV